MGRQIRLESMLVIEEEAQPLALTDQWIERGKDMDPCRVCFDPEVERSRQVPVLAGARPLEVDRHELPPARLALDEAPDRRPTRDPAITDGVQADEALRAQCPLEHVAQDLRLRSHAWQPLPAEMPRGQLVGFQHTGPPADRDEPSEEGELQSALGGFAARPRVVLLDEHVIVDVANRERASAAYAPEHSANVGRRHRSEPAAVRPGPLAHRAYVIPEIIDRQIRERVSPVLEHAALHRLCLIEVLAPVVRNPRVEDVVMTSLDHMDGVDLHVAEVPNGGGSCRGTAPERRIGIQSLSVQPDGLG